MKLIAPDYFGAFKCIAGKCRHSCCIGWEIDIDADSLARYESARGAFGKRLMENICAEGETAHFRLGEKERCPFLNDENLCDIIIEMGEDALCEICADHPRFRNFLSDRTEIGLGLCCEAAGRLILAKKEKTCLKVLEDDGEDEALWEEEAEILQIREELLEIAQDRSMDMDARMERILDYCEAELPEATPEQLARRYAGLEMLDSAWGEMLDGLSCFESGEACLDREKWNIPFEQLLVYLIYRHILPAAEDENLSGRAAFIAMSICLIRLLCEKHLAEQKDFTMDDFIEIARMYSSEIEYSDENLDALMDIE